jgi:hypothetical protein
LQPFPGNVRVAVGDVNGDGTPDIVTATGPGRVGRIRVFDGVTGEQLPGMIGNFVPFGNRWKKGLFVAAGDTTGDGRAEIIVGQDVGGNRVRIFDGATGRLLRTLWPFGRPHSTGSRSTTFVRGYRGGVTVAAANTHGDGRVEIIVGRRTGRATVRIFRAADGKALWTVNAFPDVARGVFVAAGNVEGDGRAEIIVGTGGGSRNRVRVLRVADKTEVVSAAVFAATFAGGVRVAAVDHDGDGLAEVLVGSGASAAGPRVALRNGLTLAELDAFFAGGAEVRGVFVG